MPTLDTQIHSLRFTYTRHTHGTGSGGDTIRYPLNEYTSAQTLSASHYMVLVNAIGGGITVTLPAASAHKGRVYTIKKIDSSANGITIDGNSTETIDGSETILLTLQYSYVTIVCDGTEWFIIGGEYVKIEDILQQIRIELKEANDKLRKIEIHQFLQTKEKVK